MVDRYWRKINDVENDVENSIQISSILLKIKEYDKKLGNNETNISSNLGKININETNISSNLGKIDNMKEFLISPEDLKKLLILKNKYLDLIKPHTFILFLKERSYMISLKIVYYL